MATIQEDTRQQVHGGEDKHAAKHRWWEAHGVTVVRRKLDFGDYATEGSNVVVDTKRSVAELAMDCGRDHARFAREMDRAREAGYRLVILVEASGYRSTADLDRWVSDACRRRCGRWRARTCDPWVSTSCTKYGRKPMQGPTLRRIAERMAAEHGCVIEFANPRNSARRVCELLGVEYDE